MGGAAAHTAGARSDMAKLNGWLVERYVKLVTFRDGLLEAQEGQTLAEYGLILFLIAVVCVLALTFLGTQISTLLSNVGNDL
jgi:pilus assembly protein Flp/PilA